jgi:hypothetical protein
LVYGREKWISDWAWPKRTVLGSTFAWLQALTKATVSRVPNRCSAYVSFLLSGSGSLEQRWLWLFKFRSRGMRITFAMHWLGLCLPGQCLRGSRREMPTGLIDCIVHFMFCWEL